MWGFVNCTRYYMSFGVPKVVLFEADLAVRTDEKVGVLIPPGTGKSTIIRLLAGADHPDSGAVVRDDGGWPLGYSGAFVGTMTGEENIHNIARLVGLDPLEMSAFCLEFSELGDDYFQPLQLYSNGMRGRLAFAASFAIPAKTYLADEKVGIGDEKFRDKCAAALADRLRTAGLILVASKPQLTRDICDRHGALIRGKFVMCASHEEASEVFGASVRESAADEFEDELASFDLA